MNENENTTIENEEVTFPVEANSADESTEVIENETASETVENTGTGSNDTADEVASDEVVEEAVAEKSYGEFKIINQFDLTNGNGIVYHTYFPDQIVTLPLEEGEKYVAEGNAEAI